uniref:chromate efflux transporter n=1 Tax=Thiorhodovibrio winogradskyi TaxID=77007 RepID=UPI0038B5DB2D
MRQAPNLLFFSPARPDDRHPGAIFLVFLRLGLTSFGGPIAHLGYFRAEFVTRRRWLSEASYAELVALCQFLPGPASSQVGMALGLTRAGYAGALAAWVGFTLPSALAMILLALGLVNQSDAIPAGALHGLKLAAVAVVAQAVWGMARSLCPDRSRVTLMAGAACGVLLIPFAWMQVVLLLVAGLIGAALFAPTPPAAQSDAPPPPIGPVAGLAWLALFALLLIGLPLIAVLAPTQALTLIDASYRAGSLVFGGGHVVLPLLQAEFVTQGWIDPERFLAGYGAAQALPGPLFTFGAFLGATRFGTDGGWLAGGLGGLLGLLAIFAPSFLLVAGVLPFWNRLRHHGRLRAALSGINAAVVGLLLAALYQPVWRSTVEGPADFALALLALVALQFWTLPPWLVVFACAGTGWMVLGLS